MADNASSSCGLIIDRSLLHAENAISAYPSDSPPVRNAGNQTVKFAVEKILIARRGGNDMSGYAREDSDERFAHVDAVYHTYGRYGEGGNLLLKLNDD